MDLIYVSPTKLREKARLIRQLLDDTTATHYDLWNNITNQTAHLSKDLQASHAMTNDPWHEAVQLHLANYHQMALNMEAMADYFEALDHNIETTFNDCGCC